MAKRRTYEQKLLDDMRSLPPDRWFKCPEQPDYDKFVYWVKIFIDSGEYFEFSEDYTKIRRRMSEHEYWQIPVISKMKPSQWPPGVTAVMVNPGEEIHMDIPTKKQTIHYVHVVERGWWSIRHNGIEIKTEKL